MDRLAAQGLHTPLILRFTDIIGERIAKLNVSKMHYNLFREEITNGKINEFGMICLPGVACSLADCLEVHSVTQHSVCLQAAFAVAARRCCYPGRYQGVFPVKCNHDPDVVSAVLEFGGPYGFGLEVGSKAELLLAMAMMAETLTARQEGVSNPTGASTAHVPAPLLVCNGYKDLEYVELVR